MCGSMSARRSRYSQVKVHPRQQAVASDVLDALSRRHDVGNPYAEAPADRDDLSLCNECAIREHVERRTGLTVQFDDAALVQVQKIAYPQLRAADLHRKADVDFLKQPQIGAAVLPQLFAAGFGGCGEIVFHLGHGSCFNGWSQRSAARWT